MAASEGTEKTSLFNIQMRTETVPGQRSHRPGSARPSSSRPSDKQTMQKGSHLFNRAKSGMVSYEDLLVAQYLDDLRRQKTEMRTEKEVPPSPYLQRLPHANLIYGRMARANKPRRRHRPASAFVLSQSQRGTKPKIDAKFIADESLWDPATPRETQTQGKGRPASAPIRRTRPASGCSVGSLRSRRSRPGSASTSIYKRQPRIITACAYKNGTRDIFYHASAPSLKIFLELVTEKLGLGFAARRVFLEDGVEVFDGADIPPHADVYISMGENYKDPFGKMKENMIIRQGAKWSLQGIILPEDRKKPSRHKMSKRLKNLSKVNTMRIIIYKNGKSLEPHEVVVDPEKFDEFLQACTARLELQNFAKKVYDWEGNEITDLEDTPVLDDCLQNKGGQVRGPLWISSGEGFSPMGTQEFLVNIRQVIRHKLKNTLFYQKEVSTAMEDDGMEKVTLLSVKSMKSDELYFALEEVEEEIKQLKGALSHLKKRIDTLEEKAVKEEVMGASYRMTHIQEVSADDRLLGHKGLRLKVYENGMQDGEFVYYFNLREAARGIGDKEQLLKRLLDELSYTVHAARCPQPRLYAIAQHIFNKYGKEITNVFSLKNDDQIWVSYGEAFVSPFTYCLEVFYDKTSKGMSTKGSEHILRDPMVDPDLHILARDHSKWEASIGFPIEYDYDEAAYTSKEKTEEVDQQIIFTELDSRATYLLMKENHSVVLYPELAMNEKLPRRHSDSQLWIISKSGYIYNKGMPQLCLGVSDVNVAGRLFVRDVPVEGFMVTLQKKMAGNSAQIWKFATNGTISVQSHPQLVLTYLENKYGDDDSYNNKRPNGLQSGVRVYLVVADLLSKKDMACQRFAVKQERMDNLGQWKHTDVANPEWNKLALSWPVKQDGEINEKYDWPMEGFLLPFAPNPQSSTRKGSGFTVLPARLSVMKNGESNTSGAVTVVGPNLTTMMKQDGRERKGDKGRKQRMQENSTVEGDDLNLHCMNYSVQELEFTMDMELITVFLDSCTLILNLPFAARRLFDERGEEHFTLQSLKRDQLVYVSCGEGWSDPKLTREEQQRRILLSQLSSDVGKIRQYCSQRNPQGFLLEVEGKMTAGSRLVLGREGKQSDEDLAPLQNEPEHDFRNSCDLLDVDAQDTSRMTAHERAHYLSEQRQNELRWPWERVVNVTNSIDASDLEAQKYSDPQLYEKFKPKPPPSVLRETLQRFVYEDGFIACSANHNLVLSALVQEGRNSEVVLAKRLPDDLSQRWTIHANGEIRSRYNQKQVLTVAFPTDFNIKGGDSQPQPLAGSAIILQGRRLNQFGHAHQRWHYDAESGFIRAFSTDLPDKEITAANKSDVCTFAISGPVKIDQPGYRVELHTRSREVKGLKVCVSCARAMRGRHKLKALPPNSPFACAMGQAKKHKLPQIGSFRVLNGKVDLSTHEAHLTLQKWEEQLENLRQQTTLTIYKEINAARTVTTVKVMAYKNGEGRMRPGEVICGSTVEGILQQCISRLGLNSAARHLYAEEGTMLLDIDDIIGVAVNLYRNALADKLQTMLEGGAEEGMNDNRAQEERLQQLQSSAGHEVEAMMSKALANVQLFREEGEDSDEDRGQGDEGLPYRVDEQDVGESEDERTRTMEDGKGDTVEDNKIAKRREELLSRIELPPLDTILRYPVEVWVSSGKNFVPPEVVESKEENRRKKRALRAQVCLELDVEKHCLRQMKGRRFKDQNPGAYKSVLSCTQPVVLEGHWQQATVEEADKTHAVSKLQNHLGEIQANQKQEKTQVVGINFQGALYKQPVLKRALVYPNGESPEHAMMVWGETLSQLLDNATLKLAMWKSAKFFFTEDGKKIETLEEIKAEQLLCVSSGKPFIRPQALKTTVEVRANWGRARKQYGPGATDISVSAHRNPRVNRPVQYFSLSKIGKKGGPIRSPRAGPATDPRPAGAGVVSTPHADSKGLMRAGLPNSRCRQRFLSHLH